MILLITPGRWFRTGGTGDQGTDGEGTHDDEGEGDFGEHGEWKI